MIQPKRIIFSGGGVRGMAHIGALEELEKAGLLIHVREWIGVSAGSILALMLSVGYSLRELGTFCREFDFTQVVDLDDATGWLFKLGMDTGERLKRLIEALLKEKGFSVELTFSELAKSRPKNPTIRIYVTNLNSGRYKVFSHIHTPHYKVVDAVRASSAIPVYFQPLIDNDSGNILVDGGVISNFPLQHMTEKEQSETLGLNLCKKVEQKDDIEMTDMLYRPILIGMREISKLENALFRNNCILIETRITNPLAFNLTPEEKAELVEEGRDAVRRYIRQNRPIRRWSVS
jgi:NTE family protein